MLVGKIIGKTSPEFFDFEVTSVIKKMDFIAVRDPERHWVLGRVDDISQEKEQTVAKVSVIGYFDKREAVRAPKMPFKPGSFVYKADDDLIKRVLGLKGSGLYVGLLEGSESLKVFLDPKPIITRHLAVLAKSGFGKCISGDTPILTYKDGLITAEQIFNSSEKIIKKNDKEEVREINLDVVSLNPKNLRLEPKKALFAYRKEYEKTYILKTNSGREIEISQEHPFLTISGGKVKFVRADMLSNKMWIGIPRKIVIEEKGRLDIKKDVLDRCNDTINAIRQNQILYEKAMDLRKQYGIGSKEIAKRLGASNKEDIIDHWIYSGRKPLELNEKGSFTLFGRHKILKPINYIGELTPELAKFLAYTISESVEVINEGRNYYRIGFTNDSERLVSDFKNLTKSIFDINLKSRDHFHYLQSWNLKTYLDSIGYTAGRLSGDKDIPNFLLYADKESLAYFLKAFFDCEGWVEKNSIAVVTKSKNIANKISYLLLRFDVHSRICRVFKRATNAKHKGDVYFAVYISGSDNLRLFKKFIGFSLEYKNKKLGRAIREKSNTNVDVIPAFGNCIKNIRNSKNISQKQLAENFLSQYMISLYERNINNPSRKSFKVLAERLDNDFMKILSDSDVMWDKIKSIEVKNGKQFLYDLTVEDNHTFIGGFGGIILHNSYFLGVLLEEFIENKIPAVIIDPHGEYVSLQDPNDKQEEIKYMEKFGTEPKGYKRDIDIFCLEKNLMQNARKLKLDGRLNSQEIFEMLPFRLTTSQLGVIYSIVKDDEQTKYTLDEIKREVVASKSTSKWNVLTVLDYLKSTRLFDNIHYTKPTDLVKKGKLSIINMKGIDPDFQQILVYKIARDLFEARKANQILPFLLVIEEAHNFCPERGFGEAVSSRILRTVASEGRKFAMGLAIISQRPARVDKNVLSQCSTQVFLRVTNPNDLKSIMDSVEGISRGLEGEIKTLPVGTGLVVGLIDQPLLVNVRIKRSNHIGAPMILPQKMKEEEESDTLYFYPRYLEEDIKKQIKKMLEQFKLVYYPFWRLSCKFNTPEGEKIDNLYLDAITGELVFMRDNKLVRTQGLQDLVKLKMKEKAALLYLTSYGISTAEQMSKRLKINEFELHAILMELQKQKLAFEENKEYKSRLDLNFEEVIENQINEETTSVKLIGETLPFKFQIDDTNRVLDIFNPDAVERKKCYYPYWFIFYEDGNVEIIDAITGEKDDKLVESKAMKYLPL